MVWSVPVLAERDTQDQFRLTNCGRCSSRRVRWDQSRPPVRGVGEHAGMEQSYAVLVGHAQLKIKQLPPLK